MAGVDGAEALVGLVIVSHSAKVADGTLELASQMAGDDVRIVAAGGLEDGSIGTDATRIMAAIEKADAGAGVVVMVDLGSAVLSASTALELLDPAQAARVRLSRGPASGTTSSRSATPPMPRSPRTSSRSDPVPARRAEAGRRRGGPRGRSGRLVRGRASRSVERARHARRQARYCPGPRGDRHPGARR
jgi:PTS hybrid protein